MVQLSEIKKEIEELPKQEYNNLRQWFAEKDWEIWDKQIKEDSNSGKLDFLTKEALQEKKDKGGLNLGVSFFICLDVTSATSLNL
jgi:hypothetical protein